MTPSETRLSELLDQLEATLREVRALLAKREGPADDGPAKAVEAFADEAFRDRDA